MLFYLFCAAAYIDDLEVSEPEKYPGRAIFGRLHLHPIEIAWFSSLAFTVESTADQQTRFSTNGKRWCEVTALPVSSTTENQVQLANVLGWQSSCDCTSGRCSALSNPFYILKMTKWMKLRRTSYHDTYQHLSALHLECWHNVASPSASESLNSLGIKSEDLRGSMGIRGNMCFAKH